jgi:hypothetical protein
MKTVIIITIILLHLIISKISINYTKKAHYDKDGKWQHCDMGSTDLFFCLFPVINMITFIDFYVFGNWTDKRELKKSYSLTKFIFGTKQDYINKQKPIKKG